MARVLTYTRTCADDAVARQAGLQSELRAVGLEPLGGPADNDRVLKPAEFSLDMLDRGVRCVVVGSDRCAGCRAAASGVPHSPALPPCVMCVVCSRMNYFKLAMASSYLRYVPGCRFVATNGCVPCGVRV